MLRRRKSQGVIRVGDTEVPIAAFSSQQIEALRADAAASSPEAIANCEVSIGGAKVELTPLGAALLIPGKAGEN